MNIGNLTKEEALKNIDQLKKFVEDIEKSEINALTVRDTDREHHDAYINGQIAIRLFKAENGWRFCEGSKKTGHKASAFLWSSCGQWLTEEGIEVSGYLYFKPKD